MGASSSTTSSTVEKVTIDKKLVNEHMLKHGDTVRELLSVKNRVSDLQEALVGKESQLESYRYDNENVNRRMQISEDKLKNLEEKLASVSRLLYLERAKNVQHNQLDQNRENYLKYLNEKQEELNDLNQSNAILETSNFQLKSELKQLKDNNSMLKEENSILQKSNIDLKNKLEQENENNSELKLEIYGKELLRSVDKTTIMGLEKELHKHRQNLEELKEKLAEETVTDETLRKIIQIHRRVKEMQPMILKRTDGIVKHIKENDRSQKDKIIEKLKSDYDNCEEILRSKNITINRTDFIDVYAKYKHLSKRNDDNKKDILKQVYQIEKTIQNFPKKIEIFSENLNKDVEKAIKSENDLNVNVLTQVFTAEEELYQDVLKIAKEEILFREKILQIQVGASKSKDCNILNNGKPNKFSAQAAQTLQDANNTEDTKGVILFGAPDTNKSDHEDRLMIFKFLEKHGLDYEIFKNRRFRKDKNGKRPLVIEFTNEEIVKKIMELGQQRNWFLGFNLGVRVYINNKQKSTQL